ncbi:MAG: hypothetical protein ACHQUA_00250 [Microgenomates group bacterium]
MKSKGLIESKNFLFVLAAFALVALGAMGYMVYRQNVMIKSFDKTTETLKTQSSDDDIESIDKDTNDTNFDDVDKELIEIDSELKSTE